eukprot:7600900-Pyramimonas_sp.AAC.1
MTDIMVRHHNKLARSQWQAAFRSSAVSPPQPIHPRPGPKAGKAGSGSPDAAGSAGRAAGGRGGAGLLGRALSRKEYGRSLDHRPKSPASGRIICWDNSSWK